MKKIPMVGVPDETTQAAARKVGVARSALALMAGAVALAVLALLARDYHRRSQALDGAREYAEVLARERIGESGVLPLNFEPGADMQATADDFKIEWLKHEEAVHLRRSRQPIIVAWTKVLPLWLGRNGRAVISFHEGRLAVDWLGNQVFDQRIAAQQEELKRLEADSLTLP